MDHRRVSIWRQKVEWKNSERFAACLKKKKNIHISKPDRKTSKVRKLGRIGRADDTEQGGRDEGLKEGLENTTKEQRRKAKWER